jgi:hypothetical protein
MSEEEEIFGETALAQCQQLAQGFSDLVIEVSGRERLPALRDIARSLADQCKLRRLEEAAQLAKALARCCDFLFEGRADPGQALPLLASGTETLERAIRSTAEPQPQSESEQGLAAARYELETLFPVAGQPAKANKTGPDVNLHQLRRPKPSSD